MNERPEHHLGEDLMAIADGGADLSPARKHELDAHVAGCGDCQAAIASAKLVLRAIDAAEIASPSPSFDRALFVRLDALDRETKTERASFIERLRIYFTLPKIAFAVAATASIAVAVVVIDRRGTDSAMPIELAMNLEGLRLAENLDLYRNLEVVENLDVLDDLDTIQALEEDG